MIKIDSLGTDFSIFRHIIPAVITGLFTFSAACIAACIATKSIKKQLKDNLDSKSGWRRDLFKLSSKRHIFLKDIYILRSTLRFKPKSVLMVSELSNGDYKVDLDRIKNFNGMTSFMIHFCELLVQKYRKKKIEKLSHIESEMVRIFARYLLKDHWERNSDKTGYERDIVKETIELIKNVRRESYLSVDFYHETRKVDNNKVKVKLY